MLKTFRFFDITSPPHTNIARGVAKSASRTESYGRRGVKELRQVLTVVLILDGVEADYLGPKMYQGECLAGRCVAAVRGIV